ncbi:hypothetical protein [Streptomyces filamentosus]|uniref:hypothetical protein n=1 Tax=Streptomyces filamentosus TaxID=67294 RepID=UPI0033D183EC
MARIDPELDRAVSRAVGHGFPLSVEERASVVELVIQQVRDIGPLVNFYALERLIMVGCDPVDLSRLTSLKKIDMLSVEDSALRDLSQVDSFPLLDFTMPRNFVADLEPLLSIPTLLQVDVTGNPLSEVSYREIIPELINKGRRVRFSSELEWSVSVRLCEAGVGVVCYESSRGYRLCRPGLAWSKAPQYGHPLISRDDVEGLLHGDPEQACRFFA